MTQSRLRVIRESLFPKGYNDKLPPEYIPNGYLADAKNCFITEEKIEKRTGYSTVGNDTGDTAILGLQGITTSGGVKRLYKFCDNADETEIEIWEYTGSGNWASVDATLFTTSGVEVNCAVAENKVIAFNANEAPVIITPGSPSTAAAAADANFPKGKYGIWFHNFLFVAGVSSNPNRLYWSDLGDSDDFTNGVTGSADINPDDGDVITGLNILGNELIIFKRNRIWSLSGFGTDSFTVASINERITGYGCVSHRSAVNVGNDIYYLSHVGGAPEFRSLQRTRYGTIVEGGNISDDIQGSMDGLAEDQLSIAASVFDGRRAYMAVPGSGETTNTKLFVRDTVSGGWVRWTGLVPSIWAEFNFSNESEIYFGEGGDNSLVYKLDSSTSDNGTAIDFAVKTRGYGVGIPEVKKKWKYLYVVAEEEGDYDLTVKDSPDDTTYESLGTVDLSPQGTVFPVTLDSNRLGAGTVVRERLYFSKRNSYHRHLEFSNDNLDESAAIRHWELLYYPRGLRDA